MTLRDGYIAANTTNIGKAGAIILKTDSLSLEFSGIYTEAIYAGGEGGGRAGGNVNIKVRDWLYMNNSKITAESRSSEERDNGGNLTISNPKLFTLKDSELMANANFGHGGEINIYAGKIVGSNSKINVSSRVGLNGNFYFNSIGLTEAVVLPGQRRLEEKHLLPSRCAAFSKENLSRFIITTRDILPRSPEDWRTHSLRLPR